MKPIEKLYALLESNGIYNEAISLLKEHRSIVMETSEYDKHSQDHVVIEIPEEGQEEPRRIIVTPSDLPVNKPRALGSPLMKLKLVALVSAGLFSYEEAEKRYDMSKDELDYWVDRYKKYGTKGVYSQKTGSRETKKLKKTRD